MRVSIDAADDSDADGSAAEGFHYIMDAVSVAYHLDEDLDHDDYGSPPLKQASLSST